MASSEGDGAFEPGTFSDVDASGLASEHAAYLDRAASVFADQRRSWLALLNLQPGELVLDAGSGMGEVTSTIATMIAPGGRAIGVDLSAELVERARQRARATSNIEYHVGNLTNLPLENATFDAVYCERVFQHLAEPDAVMAELFRVLRPGGRLATVDPDFTRAAQDADDPEVTDVLTNSTRRIVANPSSGRQLRSQTVRAGFVDVVVHPTLSIITDAEQYRALSSPSPLVERLQGLVTSGELTRGQADAFIADQDLREAEGRFLAATPIYCITGTKPTKG